MKIITSTLTKNDCYKSNRTITVRGLMIHSVGCPQPSAKPFINNWNKPGVSKAVHGFIEPDGDVYLTLPCLKTAGKAMRGWHGGKTYANNKYLGFEMTEPKTIKYTSGSGWKDMDKEATRKHVLGTYNTAVELFAKLCDFHNIDPTGKYDGKPTIISHSEGAKFGVASNHGDVEHIWKKCGLTMEQFRKDIKAKMDEKKEAEKKESTTTAVKYRLKEDMNIRALPTSNSELRGVAKKGTYTVVEFGGSGNKWGRLKSGVGWVCLSEKYAEKVK